MKNPEVYSTGDLARLFGCHDWQIRKIFKRGMVSPAARLGPYRVVAKSDLPEIQQALEKAGYLGKDAMASAD